MNSDPLGSDAALKELFKGNVVVAAAAAAVVVVDGVNGDDDFFFFRVSGTS